MSGAKCSRAALIRRFPADHISAVISAHADGIQDAGEKAAFSSLTAQLSQAVLPYTKSMLAGIPGSERALQCFLALLRVWISNERWFCDGKTYADAVDSLRKTHKDDTSAVLAVCRAHERLPATCEIVIRLISIIADGTRVDFQSSTPSAIGKRVSLVAGAESLPHVMPLVSEIGSMDVSEEYSEVSLLARKLLMQESMPSLEQRRLKVLTAAKALVASGDSKLPHEAEALLADHIPMSDVFFPLLQSISATDEEVGLLELYLRHLYRPYTLQQFARDKDKRLVKFSFLNTPSEGVLNTATSVTSMTELRRMVSSGSLNASLGSLNQTSEGSEHSASESTLLSVQRIPHSTLRHGACVVIEKLDDLSDATRFETALTSFPQFTGKTPCAEGGPTNVLYFFILDSLVGADEASNDVDAERCKALLEPYKALLKKADIRRVSFAFNQEQEDDFQNFGTALFTFRSPEFREDALYRRIYPSLSTHLHLNRVAANFSIRSLGSRHTSMCQVHLYEATPARIALKKDRNANKQPRIFARALSLMIEFSSSGFERLLVDALNAMDVCPRKSKTDNHLFLNLVSDFERTVIDPVVVEQVVVDILKRHSDRVSGLGIVEVETRIVCCLSSDSPPIAIRLFASNPTGYVQVMNTYVEAASEMGGDRVFMLISGTKASLASAGDSSWDGLDINTPYPLTRPFDAQRKAALKSSDTIYCYDLPALFEAAVEKQWREAYSKRGVEAGRPLMVMYTNELVVRKKGGEASDPWTMKDYLNGDLELTSVNRRAGANDVGMVAWEVTLKTVEYPNVSRALSCVDCLLPLRSPLNETRVSFFCSGTASCAHCERHHAQSR